MLDRVSAAVEIEDYNNGAAPSFGDYSADDGWIGNTVNCNGLVVSFKYSA